jgi:hypothetical protein
MLNYFTFDKRYIYEYNTMQKKNPQRILSWHYKFLSITCIH